MAFTYVGKFLSGMKGLYDEINPSTLSGAIDVIIVQQEDGTFLCSPFHVKFGKLGVIRSREKIVDIEINEVYVEDLHMKLGDSGEAFFVQEIESDDGGELTDDLATSPIWSGTEDGGGGPVNQLVLPDDVIGEPDDDMSADDAKHVNQIVFFPDEGVDGALDVTGAVLIAPSSPPDDPIPQAETPGKTEPKQVITALRGIGETSPGPSVKAFKPTVTRRKKKNLKRANFKNEDILPHQSDQVSQSKVRFKVPPPPPPTPGPSEQPLGPKGAERDTIFHMEQDDDQPQPGPNHATVARQTHESPPEFYSSARPSFSQPGAAEPCATFEVGTLPLTLAARGAGLNNSKIVAFSENDLASYISAKTEGFFQHDPDRYKSDTEIESETNKVHLSPVTDPASYCFNVVEWNWGKLPERKTNSQPNSPDKNYSLLLADSFKDSKYPFGTTPPDGKQAAMAAADKSPPVPKAAKGVYLDDLKNGEMDPEVAAVYFPQRPTSRTSEDPGQTITKDQSDVGEIPRDHVTRQSLDEYADTSTNSAPFPPPHVDDNVTIEYPSSPSSITSEKTKEDRGTDRMDTGWGLSLCGTLDQGTNLTAEISPERFERYEVTYDDLVKDPGIFLNPELVCRLNERYYSWQIAVPIIASLYLFDKPLPESSLEVFAKLLPPKRSARSSWFPWRSRYHSQYPHHKVSTESVPSLPGNVRAGSVDAGLKLNPLKRSTSFDSSHPSNGPNISNGDVMVDVDGHNHTINRKVNERFKKTIRLTSDQIVKLNLVNGCNDVTFSVTTQFQGTTRCASHIFLWRYDDKIVISDIDGTITKSDVLGHIFPFLGKDWSQIGVAELYSRIRRNGYQFVYLSSRAIGQAPGTRGYLKSLKQNNMPLPEGPILLNPNSLLTAIHKEVIEKKPEEFKISCLRDIRVLFSASRNPFYAGFGNRINDVYAYRAVDIPISRIFTINHRGEITVELTKTFQSSYTKLQDLVDQLFPPLKQLERKRVTDLLEADRYSSFTFWRSPMHTLEELDDDEEATSINPKAQCDTPPQTAQQLD